MGEDNIGFMTKDLKTLISIIVPVYNVERYIEECLDSLLNQSYKNIEIIIVNDGSTDRSDEIIKKYAILNPNIIYLQQKNSGQAKARNTALKYVKGKYVIFIDSDDFLNKNALEKMYNNINESNSQVCIAGYYEYYNSTNKKKVIFKNNKTILNDNEIIEEVLNNRLQCLVSFKLFESKLLRECNFKFEVGRLFEDFFPILKAMTKANKVSVINEPVFYYRQRSDSSIRSKRISKVEDYFYATSLVLDYINVNYKEVIKVNSLNNFKVSRFSYMINLIVRNVKAIDRYNYLENKGFNEVNLGINKIIFSKARIKDKILCLLWKTKMFFILEILLN